MSENNNRAVLAEAVKLASSPIFMLVFLFIAVMLYLMMSPFVWSFRLPLIFCGISFIAAGILLFVVSRLPVNLLIEDISLELNSGFIETIANTLWTAFSGKALIGGIIVAVSGSTMLILSCFAKNFRKNTIAG